MSELVFAVRISLTEDWLLLKANKENKVNASFFSGRMTFQTRCYVNLNNIYFENNQTIQYIKHSNYNTGFRNKQLCFYKSVSYKVLR